MDKAWLAMASASVQPIPTKWMASSGAAPSFRSCCARIHVISLKGTGSFSLRLLYCVSTIVWSKRDDGTWGPNSSKIGGNIVAGAIANVCYPPNNRGFNLVFERAFTVTAESSIGAFFDEFWPDIDQKFFNNRWASRADMSIKSPLDTDEVTVASISKHRDLPNPAQCDD
jgi:hypothetical protein